MSVTPKASGTRLPSRIAWWRRVASRKKLQVTDGNVQASASAWTRSTPIEGPNAEPASTSITNGALIETTSATHAPTIAIESNVRWAA